MNVFWTAALAVVNVAVAVWFIRGGRRKFGPWWTAGWVGYAVLDVVAIWWPAVEWLAIACGVVAVMARSRRVRAARTRVPAEFFDDTLATPDVPAQPSEALTRAARLGRRTVTRASDPGDQSALN